MFSRSVPNDFTLSPSEATPHLTINHDVAADLDSTNAFEGPEKLLEVWFAPGVSELPPGTHPDGLRSVPADTWVGMLDMVNCKILSVLQSESVDAYLLSESSMFVFPHKLILKTCGTTTLLLGLQRMLHIAAHDAGFPFRNADNVDDVRAAATPYRVFYSRKNFIFPDRQRGPHRSWKQEVRYLDDKFEGGSAYMVGKMNGDHWYLYITSPNQALTPPRTPKLDVAVQSHVPVDSATTALIPGNCDETLEILMTDLDPENAKQFYLAHASEVARKRMVAQDQDIKVKAQNGMDEEVPVFGNGEDMGADLDDMEALTTEGHALGTVVSETCGLSDVYPTNLYPDARVDAYLFGPCGFSANGIVPPGPKTGADGAVPIPGQYFTVHVTPEPECSFASFETNVPGGRGGRTTAEIIEHVVSIFRPGRFSVTLFEAKGMSANPYGMGENDGSSRLGRAEQRLVDPVRGYRRIDRIVHDFDDYDLVFRFYERDGWAGEKGPRVGEID